MGRRRDVGGAGPITLQFLADLGNGDAEYSVNSYHTYAEATTTANPYSLTVSIDDNTGPGTNESQSGDIQADDASEPRLRALNDQCDGGRTADQFIPWNVHRRELAGDPLDFAVQVNWGDGTTTAATVLPFITAVQSGGTSVTFAVEASHTYTTPGMATVTTTVNDNEGSSVTLTTTVDVAGEDWCRAAPIVLTEGPTIPAGTVVGSFTDSASPSRSPITRLPQCSSRVQRPRPP